MHSSILKYLEEAFHGELPGIEAHRKMLPPGRSLASSEDEIRVIKQSSILLLDGDSIETLLTKADLAMYRAKELGRGRITCFEHQMYEKIVGRMHQENLLKEALFKRELYLMYQPQVDIKTKKITGFEALIRWQNPELGLVPPTAFIPIAEETQLIMPIGAWVIDTAFAFIKQTENFSKEKLSVAVNISVLQLIQENFENILDEAVIKHKILPEQVVLEITETVLIQAMDVSISKLERLKIGRAHV